MTTTFHIDPTGRYLGAFGDGALPPPEAVAVPIPPDHAEQVWDGTGWAWPPGALRAQKLLAVAARYAAALEIGMPYAGHVLQLRESDQQNIIAKGALAKFALAGQGSWPAGFAWIMADNTTLPLDAAAMSAMADAADLQVTAWRFNARAHKDALLALGDAAAIAAYDIESGW